MDKGDWWRVYVIGFLGLVIILLPHWAFTQSLEEAEMLNEQVFQLF